MIHDGVYLSTPDLISGGHGFVLVVPGCRRRLVLRANPPRPARVRGGNCCGLDPVSQHLMPAVPTVAQSYILSKLTILRNYPGRLVLLHGPEFVGGAIDVWFVTRSETGALSESQLGFYDALEVGADGWLSYALCGACMYAGGTASSRTAATRRAGTYVLYRDVVRVVVPLTSQFE